MLSPRWNFDHNATTPLDPLVVQALTDLLQQGLGNPSSVHGGGQLARARIDRARTDLARALGARPSEIVWTSGATEANVLAWRGILTQPGAAAVTTAIEHPSVLAVARQLESQGVAVARVGVDTEGRLDLAAFRDALDRPGVRLASMMLANNELGVLQPLVEVAELCRSRGILLHCDATQALGKVPVDVAALGVDLLSLSGHKLGAPAGVGALWVRRGVRLQAVLPGHQEQGLRAGTENVLGIVGLGVAARRLPERLAAAGRVRTLRDRLWAGLQARVPEVVRNGAVAVELETGNTLNVSLPGIDGATLLMALDLEGMAVSSGAACASGSLEPSHVLLALGDGSDGWRRRARGAVRLSLGPEHTVEDVDAALDLVPRVVDRIRRTLASGLHAPPSA